MLDDDQVGEGREERANEQSGDPISSGRMGETSLMMMMGPQRDGRGERKSLSATSRADSADVHVNNCALRLCP